ncbi:hypothetical protein CPC08DRAFT_705519 [Agrocybe pediades]|nr:hypothetical protein CPC08DRAFT_705519 [Agrocybe pediades]
MLILWLLIEGYRRIHFQNHAYSSPQDLSSIQPAYSMEVRALSDSSQSNTRTLVDIIWNCLSTIFLCTWVSIHPNLPPAGEGQLRSVLRRVYMMFWALVMSEMMVIWSFRQWVAARAITKIYRERTKDWTMSHSFLLVMDGFALYKGDENMGTLTYDLFDHLDKEDEIEFPMITAEEISDKSKGDPLSKLLVILQTCWFIAQCIARAIQGLAVTNLEIVTLGLCSLNAAMYFFWWRKPLNVKCRIPVYLLPQSNYVHVSELRRARVIVDETRASKVIVESLSGSSNTDEEARSNLETFHQLFHPFRTRVAPANGQLYDFYYRVFEGYVRSDFKNRHRLLFLVLFPFRFLWLIAALIVYFAFVTLVSPVIWMLGTRRSQGPISGRDRLPTFYAPQIAVGTDKLPNIMFIILLGGGGTMFGGIHCIAWLSHFPTPTESLIWRVLSVYITVTPAAIFLAILIRTQMGRLKLSHLWLFSTTVFILVLIWLYVYARLILLAEAFISLRRVPPSTLLDVDWSKFIPHL